jgi:hypothetical protein
MADPTNIAEEIARIRGPFVKTAAFWGLFGALVSLVARGDATVVFAFTWYAVLYALSVFDLVSIAGLSRVLLGGTQNKLQGIIWGLAKVGCLGLFGLSLWKAKTAPTASVLTGLATLIVVPLVGSMAINTQKLKLKG